MDGLDVETSLKILVVGNGMVGKSSLISKFVHGHVTGRYKKTIGVEFAEKEIRLPSGEDITLMIWDTAGQDMFSSLTKSYYGGAAAVAYVFSTTDRESFLAIENWRTRVLTALGCNAMNEPLSVLVQTKVDLLTEAQVTFAEADALAARLRMPLFRVATTNESPSSDVFPYIAARYVKALRDGDLPAQPSGASASGPSTTSGVAALTTFAKPNIMSTVDTEPTSSLHQFAFPPSTTARQISTNESAFGASASTNEAVVSANAFLTPHQTSSIAQPFVPYWDRTDIVLPKEPLTRRATGKDKDCTIA